MPKLTVENVGEFDVPAGKRLVLALKEDAGIDQLHACGGGARCTTCKVEFISGEPVEITVAEKNVLAAKGLSGVRLSCQIACNEDMSVRAISRFEGSGRKDCGGQPAVDIQPAPEWTQI
ncbi:2Fe-2S iron-sulfur cluster-binding protein [Planctomicrobium sp. SH668]|uniref:2Fe-2S iron-sulfur cluster-binding protein n=1 Tax=Planctomicrobium sp. SH668 TaxID=3448126 RepID=UPI003F5C7F40